MGRATVVAEQRGRQGMVPADRAVFTSIRSPMGEGYRLAATSPGITSEERRELTQRSPSHGSLCEASSSARGLASYSLQSGRHCVAGSRCAGLEHTARGGERVYTDIVVLHRADYERFGFDPLAVVAALAREGDSDVNLKLPVQLPPVSLTPAPPAEKNSASTAGGLDAPDVDRLIHILSVMMRRSRLVVPGVVEPWAVLRTLLSGMPPAVRKALSTSLGLRLSPARPFQLVLMQTPLSEVRKLLHSDEAALCEWSSLGRPDRGPFDVWLGFVSRRWSAGRLAELHELTGRLGDDSSPQSLRCAAELAEAIERAEQSDPARPDSPLGSSTQTLPEGSSEVAIKQRLV